MDHHAHESLSSDALDRELERALAVDPSPEYLARVRARVAAEDVGSVWPRGYWLAAVAGSSVVIALVVGMGMLTPRGPMQTGAVSQQDMRQTMTDTSGAAIAPAGDEDIAARTAEPAPLAAPARAAAASRSTRPDLPEVIVSADELAALRLLIGRIEDGRLTAAMWPEPLDSGVTQFGSLEIQPIVVAPITPIALLQGDVQ